jgi:1-acyl-sn-glycerol-3-phosphate acyltransferase
MRNIVRWLVRTLIDLFAKVEASGYEYIPNEKSFVIATNHLGIVDAPLAFYALDRWDMYIPVAEKWEQNPLLNWIGKYFNFIFIDRYNPDIKALRKILDLMKEGNVIAIAPEGTRSRVGSLIEGRPGVSYLATKLNRPILPVAIWGTEDEVFWANAKRLRRNHIHLKAGPAFTLPPLPRENRDEALRQYTDEIMCRIAVMMPEKYHGFYANHPRLKELMIQQSEVGVQ